MLILNMCVSGHSFLGRKHALLQLVLYNFLFYLQIDKKILLIVLSYNHKMQLTIEYIEF